MLTESPLRGIEIAKRWGVSRAAVTEAAQRLESSRMIKRKRDPRDQRAWLFELTPKGHRALEEFGRVSTEAVARYVGELTGQQQRALAEANDALFNVFSDKFE